MWNSTMSLFRLRRSDATADAASELSIELDSDVESLPEDGPSSQAKAARAAWVKGHRKHKHAVAAPSQRDLDQVDFFHQSEAGSALLSEYRARAKVMVESVYDERKQATLQSLVQSVLKKRDFWEASDWVEYLGDDMRWHLSMVRGSVLQAPDGWDQLARMNNDVEEGKGQSNWERYYNVGLDSLLPTHHVRASKEALRELFGMRPWVWQQYALLAVEKYVRFERDNEMDFMEVNARQMGLDMFNEWLEEPENEDFNSLFNSYPAHVQMHLIQHVLSPFGLLDEVTEDKERWNFFEDRDFSVFTYMSILGSGNMAALLTLVAQIAVPLLLLVNVLNTPTFQDATPVSISWDSSSFPFVQVSGGPSFDRMCPQNGKKANMLMIMSVLVIYGLTIVPDSISRFYRTSGESNTTYSRVQSLRKIEWHQGDDTLLQKIGFKVDQYINTAYVAWLYTAMLFILYNTDDLLEILLNALAADFVRNLDETVAASTWFTSTDRRWLRAGTYQLTMGAYLRLNVIDNPRQFCKKYKIDRQDYKHALNGMWSLRNHRVARHDDQNPVYMRPIQALMHECDRHAERSGLKVQGMVFKKQLVNFSTFDHLFNKGRYYSSKTGVFDQYRPYRTWSFWRKILFLSKVPDTVVTDVSAVNNVRVKSDNDRSSSKRVRFGVSIIQDLTGYNIFRNCHTAWFYSNYANIPFHILDGILAFLVTLSQLTFPFLILAAFLLVPICY